jgi:hypothetical protein
MPMIAATILALAPLPTTATPTQPASHASANAPAKCDRFGRMEQASVLRQTGPRAQRLDRLPTGDLHLTVERQVNGCHQPVIVRENIGGPAFRPR